MVKLPEANRRYKDTIFRWLFSDKENLLSLYNAVTGKHYVTKETSLWQILHRIFKFLREILDLSPKERCII